jgi:hypothetical protein
LTPQPILCLWSSKMGGLDPTFAVCYYFVARCRLSAPPSFPRSPPTQIQIENPVDIYPGGCEFEPEQSHLFVPSGM